MKEQFVARQSIVIKAPRARVWDALTNPEMVKQYMFGTNVVSDWQPGSPILFKGEWQGREYEDKGVILRLEPERLIEYTHYSPLSGVPDLPENYHTVTIELGGDEAATEVTLAQSNNATEQEREHSEQNWGMMLAGLKKLLEQ